MASGEGSSAPAAPSLSAALAADGWCIQTSKRTGQTYFFNVRTGESTYVRPVTPPRIAAPLPAPPPAAAPAPPVDPFADRVSSVNLKVFRDVVDDICRAVSRQEGITHYIFPPLDRHHKALCEDGAEEASLACESVCLDADAHLEGTGAHVCDKRVIIFSAAHVPAEVAKERDVEAQLAAEAARLRSVEAEALRTAAATSSGGGRVHAGVKRSAPEEVMKIVREKERDKRSIDEIQQDIRKRRAMGHDA